MEESPARAATHSAGLCPKWTYHVIYISRRRQRRCTVCLKPGAFRNWGTKLVGDYNFYMTVLEHGSFDILREYFSE